MASVSTTLPSDRSSAIRPGAAQFAWVVLIYILGVIVWGAYVRASGSGAGCGNHWPLCNGEVIPTSPRTQMLIEFTHRVTSGLALVSVLAMLVWTWRATIRGAWARKAAVIAVVLMLNEALLGALLVLLQHVGKDQSISRAVLLSLHLANTLLLIGSIALAAYWQTVSRDGSRYRKNNASFVVVGLLAAIGIGITGALAALGDTLFPATSLRTSMAQDFSAGSFYLLRLRLLHPVVALIGTAFVIWIVARGFRSGSTAFRNLSIVVIVLAVVQVSLGVMNVVLLAPVWLQMTHLLFADLFWIVLLLSFDELLISRTEPAASVA
ncbi:MAG TPA: COX15/CtaA family protein [Terriglobales bacterium]|nr:COX15/CtaA family protein [Terriglobales bacterium]